MTDIQFINNTINISDIPVISDSDFVKLESKYRWVLIARRIISLFFLWIIFFLTIIFAKLWTFEYLMELSLAILIFSISSLIYTYFSFDRKKYSIRSHDILYKTGILWKTESVIPFNRVQHSEVKIGPIDELFELAKLHIYTAGGSSSDLIIPGLSKKIAEKLRDYVLGNYKVSHGEEE